MDDSGCLTRLPPCQTAEMGGTDDREATRPVEVSGVYAGA
jgi:hypothetical protein